LSESVEAAGGGGRCRGDMAGHHHAPTGECGGDALGLEQRQRGNGLAEPVSRTARRAPARGCGASAGGGEPATGVRGTRPRHHGGAAAPHAQRLAVGCGGGRGAARSALLVLGALLIATQVAGQSPELLENNGGHFRFGNIRW